MRPGDARHERLPVVFAYPMINLGHHAWKLVEIALRQTAHGYYLSHMTSVKLLSLSPLKEGVDAFLLGIGYETAGIDDNNRSFRQLRVRGVEQHVAACVGQTLHELLGIDKVFRAAERYDIDSEGQSGASFHN